MKVVKYLKVWYKMTTNSFSVSLVSRFGAIMFAVGKLLRFFFFFFFLFVLLAQTKALVNYSPNQTFFFFLSFNFVDTLSQLLYREVYRFRPMIVSGDFDFVLVKPISPLFRVLFGGADVLDLFMMLPYSFLLIFFATQLADISFFSIFVYSLLILNALIIATSFHIFVLALGVITTEIDHAIMIYRDATTMGRLPIDIYKEPVRGFLTFVIPVGIMMTFPPKALMGMLKPFSIFTTFVIAGLLLILSLFMWRYSLTKYTSASS